MARAGADSQVISHVSIRCSLLYLPRGEGEDRAAPQSATEA